MTSKLPKKKSVLERRLEQALANNQLKLAYHLRNSIAAEEKSKSFKELYLGRPCILSKNDKRS